MRILVFRIFGVILLGAAGLGFYGVFKRPPKGPLISLAVIYGMYASFLLLGAWALLREGPYKVRRPAPHTPPPDATIPSAVQPPLYYIAVGDEQSGPYTLDELRESWRSGGIDEDAQYWFEGASDWQPIGHIAGLLGDRRGD